MELGQLDDDELIAQIGEWLHECADWPYTPTRVIARGGQCVIVRVDAKDQQWPARALRLGLSDAQDLEREAALLKEVAGEGIITVYGNRRIVCGDTLATALLLDLLPSTFLDHVRQEQLGLDDRLGRFRLLLEAVGRIHAKGVFHLDLKPSNVLVNEAGAPVLIDLGAARYATQQAPSTSATPGYGAPEQFGLVADDVGRKADVFALGMLLYELIAGEPLCPDDYAATIGRYKSYLDDVHEERLRKRTLGSRELDGLVRDATRKQLRDRLPDIRNFIRRLDKVLAAPSSAPADEIHRAFNTLTQVTRTYAPRDLADRPLFVDGECSSKEEGYFPLVVGRLKADRMKRPRSQVAEFYLHDAEQDDYEDVDEDKLLAAGARWFLRAGPGSGKSTLLAHLARRARQRPKPLVPLLISVTEWVKGGLALPDTLAGVLCSPSSRDLFPSVDVAELAGWIVDHIADGAACILLDGWDELGRRQDDARELIHRLLKYRGIERCPVILASRPGFAVHISDFDAHALEVRPLRAEDVEHFARLYVHDDDRAKQLIRDIDAHEDLSDLRENPFVLSLVAWLYQPLQGEAQRTLELPMRLVEVYELALVRMLERGPKDSPIIRHEWPPLLDELGWHSMEQFQRSVPTRDEFLQVLSKSLASRGCEPSLSEVVLAHLDRARVVQVAGEFVHWLHPTIQEFLAARWLARGAPPSLSRKSDGRLRIAILDVAPTAKVEYLRQADEIVRDAIWDPEQPLETLITFYGRLVDDQRRLTVARELGGMQLAIPPRLCGTIDATKCTAIGNVVGALARSHGGAELDPRLTADRRWVSVPVGPFWYGGEQRLAGPCPETCTRDHRHGCLYEIEHEFAIQRWQVTVGEYTRFLEGWQQGGQEQAMSVIERPEYGRHASSVLDSTLWAELVRVLSEPMRSTDDVMWHDRTAVSREPFCPCGGFSWEQQKRNRWNHPVVGVSWFEAWAYCAWLTVQEEIACPGTVVLLPTDAQWERAARGMESRIPAARLRAPHPSRDYPWRGWCDANRANTRLTGLARTAPVGVFPSGNTHDGVWDMVGNTWEWCADASNFGSRRGKDRAFRATLKTGGFDRVVRGGSFRQGTRDARCSSRRAFFPESRYGDFGFRPVRMAIDSVRTSPSGKC